MTRKHYEAIARALASTRPDPKADMRAHNQWDRDVEAVADAIMLQLSNFDKTRFKRACAA